MEDFSMKPLLNEYFRAKLHGGKSPLARVLDFLSLRLILFLCLFLYFSGLKAGGLLSCLLSAFGILLFTVASALVNSIRLDRLKVSELKNLQKDCAMEALSLLPETVFHKTVLEHTKSRYYGEENEKPYFLILQKTEAVKKDALLEGLRKAMEEGCEKIVLFSLSALSPEAEDFARSSEMLFFVESQNFFLHMAEKEKLLLDEEALLHRLEAKLQAQKERQKSLRNPFLRPRAKKYAILSFTLLLSSFFTVYPLYYRMMAAACAMFAGLAWFSDAKTPAGF